MVQFKAAIHNDVDALQRSAAALTALTEDTASSWEDILLRNEDLSRRMSHLSSYVGCLASSDAANEAYLKEEAELIRTRAELTKVRIELLRAIKPAPDNVFDAFVGRSRLKDAANYLNRLREEARRAMSTDKEILATDLGVDGLQAWGRLYDTVSAKLEFDMVFPDGSQKPMPMSQRRLSRKSRPSSAAGRLRRRQCRLAEHRGHRRRGAQCHCRHQADTQPSSRREPLSRHCVVSSRDHAQDARRHVRSFDDES